MAAKDELSPALELWATERQTEGVQLGLKVTKTLHEEQTPFQHLSVVETAQFGRMLFLDGMVQTSVGDEFVYHEMIAHVPLAAHPCPRRVAVIGGGDGGVVREVLKHPVVEQVVLVEIDGRVIEVARQYLPEIAHALNDARVEIRVEDGIAHVRERRHAYDVIIIDSTEPVGAAIGLFSEAFYRDVHAALAPDGLMVAQTESPFFNRDLIARAFRALRAVFGQAHLYLAAVPTYPSGLWSFTAASKGPDPRVPRLARVAGRYYTPALHRAAFVLPAFVEAILNESGA